MAIPEPHARNLRKGRHSQSGHYYFLTTTVVGRRRIFEAADRAEIVLSSLRWIHKTRRLRIDAAVVMPDHLHFAGRLGQYTLASVMHSLKSFTSKRLAAAGVKTPVWQRAYHDHALRNDEDYKNKLRYLIENPQRAGLVNRVDDYPFLILPAWWTNQSYDPRL